MTAATIYTPSSEGTLRQGEIISGLVQFKRFIGDEGTDDEPRFVEITHSFAIIVTQDCDLEWDFQARREQAKPHKKLPNILLCQANNAAEFRKNREDISSSKIWKRITDNKDERYQYLEKIPQNLDYQDVGISDLCIDFKCYFCITTEDVYWQLEQKKATRRCRLVSPYAEHFASRFYYFQARVALPRDHGSPIE